MRDFVPRFQFIKMIWNRLYPLKSYSYTILFQYSNIPKSFCASRDFDIARVHQLVQKLADTNQTYFKQNSPHEKHSSQLSAKHIGILEYWNKYIYSSSTTIYICYI